MKIVHKKPTLNLHTVIEGVIFDPRDAIPKYNNFDVRQDPIYMCDIVSPQDLHVAIANCYRVDKASLKAYQNSKHDLIDVANLTKDHQTEDVIAEPFGQYPVTRLSKVAKAQYDKHPESGYKTIIKPAIFSSIISRGTDTFSHKQGEVISERTQSRKVYNAKKHKTHWTPGDLTGVQIGLEDNFYPIRKYTPAKNVLNQLTAESSSILGMYLGF